MEKKKRYRVLLCGTNFGKFYISALLEKGHCFDLVGILAKGSDRSLNFAGELGVPFYKTVEELPEDIDIACVVLKSTLLGGQGTSLAMKLMKKGINVIQEHPVHHSDISACMKIAKENKVNYHVNSHFVNVKPISIFIDYVSRTNKKEEPVFIDLTSSLIYSSIDIIGRCLGGLDEFHFFQNCELPENVSEISNKKFLPYKSIQGVIKGIPVYIKIQNYFDPDDLDNNYLIMHRISIGSESGNTTLLSSHGPVIWSEGYPVPDRDCIIEEKDEQSFLDGHQKKYEKYTHPTSVIFSEREGPSYSNITYGYWPEAIIKALYVMKEQMESSIEDKWQSECYLKSLSLIWVEIMKIAGKPALFKISNLESKIPDPVKYFASLLSSE